MHVKVEDEELLEELANWLAARGWPLLPVDEADAEVLVPWDQDEFAAALTLRTDVHAWRAAHGGAEVSVDEDVWILPTRCER